VVLDFNVGKLVPSQIWGQGAPPNQAECLALTRLISFGKQGGVALEGRCGRVRSGYEAVQGLSLWARSPLDAPKWVDTFSRVCACTTYTHMHADTHAHTSTSSHAHVCCQLQNTHSYEAHTLL